jgi:hypothetical protein
VTISLVTWHLALNKISGEMALRFHRAEPADLRLWATTLRRMANAMEVSAAVAEAKDIANEIEFP